MIKKTTFFLAILFLAISFQSVSQKVKHSRNSAYYFYVYQISSDEVKEIFLNKKVHISDSKFQYNLIDSFYQDSMNVYLLKLAPGNYITKSFNYNFENYNLKLVNNLFVLNHELKDQAGVSVHSTNGKSITDATLSYGKTPISFNEHFQLYTFQKKKRNSTLFIEHNGLIEVENVSFYKKESNNSPAFAKYRKNFYGYNYWRSIKKSRGYIATNKPVYNQGDTLKFKAFILKNERKVNKSLQLSAFEDYENFTYSNTITPSEKGVYQGEFIITDSFKLDMMYRIAISKSHKNKWKSKSYVTNTFYVEDYQLNEIEYKAKVDDDLLEKKRLVYITTTGKDANKQAVFGASAKLILKVYRIHAIYDSVNYIPFTIWEHTIPFDVLGQANFAVPDSLLPYAKLSLQANLIFTNANNEIQEKSLDFIYDKPIETIRFQEDGQQLKILYSHKDMHIQSKKVILKQYLENSVLSKSDSISIPYVIEINPLIREYKIEWDGKNLRQDMRIGSQVAISAYRTSDSFFIELVNPRNLDCIYQVYIGENKLLEGRDKTFNLSKKYHGPLNIFVMVEFIWAGESQEISYDLPLYTHRMQIESDIAKDVEPGEKTDIKIKVKDYKNEALPNINLTAYAINAQFDNSNIPYLTTAAYVIKEYPDLQNSLIRSAGNSKGRLISAKNRRRYSLDTMAYYNFRYPENGYYADYTPLKNRSAQFSPFAVENGFVKDIAMIYVDDTLIYLKRYDDTYIPYSFLITPGLHTIKIRTQNKLIELEGVEIKENMHLLFSVDILNPPSFVKIKRSKKVLSKNEKNEFNNYFLTLKFKDRAKYIYVFQENKIVKIDQYYSYYIKDHVIGPFNPEKDVHILTNYGFITSHNFKNGNRITIKDSLLTADTNYFFRSYFSGRDEKPEDIKYAIEKSDIHLDTTPLPKRNFKWADYNKLQKYYGNFFYTQQFEAVLCYRSGNFDTLYIYPDFNASVIRLHPGYYDFYLLSSYGRVASIKNVRIAADTTFCIQNLETMKWDSLGINRLLSKFENIKGQIPLERIDLASAGFKSKDQPSDKLIVSGTVYDKDSKTPLSHVEIELKGWDGSRLKICTDSTGYFQCPILKAGIYDIHFRKASVLDNLLYLDFEAGCFEFRPKTEYNFSIQLEKFRWFFFPNDFLSLSDELYTLHSSSNFACEYTTLANVQRRDRAFGRRGVAMLGNTRTYRMAGDMDFADGDGLSINHEEVRFELNEVMAYTGGVSADYGDSLGGALYNLYYSDPYRGNVYNREGTYNVSLAGRAITPISLRSQFSDNAYWQPNLWTDENGEASFTVTFPDNITSWKSHILAMDDNKRAGQANFTTRSFLKMNATLATPRFLIEGDQTTMVGKIQNNTTDSMQIDYEFKVDGKGIINDNEYIFRTHVAKCPLTATVSTDSLELVFGARHLDKYSDGEKRYIPIYNKGVEETLGAVYILESDTSVVYQYNPAKGPVYVYVQNDAADALQNSIDYLKNYEYACNEQLASKLIAHLVDKQIKDSKSVKFSEEQKIKSLINRLEKNKNDLGCWGWWNKSEINPWMTAYVINSLLYAQNQGFEIKSLADSKKNLLKDFRNYTISNQLFILKTLSDYSIEIDFQQYISLLSNDEKSLLDQLMLQNLKSNLKLPTNADLIFDNMQQNQMGSVFISSKESTYQSNSYYLSLLAYQSLKNTGDSIELLSKMSNYFLENVTNSGWTNTYQTAMILKTLVPDILQNSTLGMKSSIVIKEISSEAIESLPMQQKIDNGHGEIHIEKLGNLPIYASCYQKSWNINPSRIEKDFKILSHLKKDFEQIDFLKAGELALLEVQIESSNESDYVIIEVPIPAGCSYNKTNDTKNPNEVHREYYKHKVVIFCEKLPIGKHRFEINLQPRYSGTYTLNPAKAELMYFPTIFGREEMKEVEIR